MTGENISAIAIEMTERQIRILKYCEKYHDKIEFIAEHGGFDVRGGRTIIDYDNANNISNLQRVLNDRPVNNL